MVISIRGEFRMEPADLFDDTLRAFVNCHCSETAGVLAPAITA